MICVDCITPAQLKKLFDTHGEAGDCKYCGRHGHAMESKQLFDYVYGRVAENVAVKGTTCPTTSSACFITAGRISSPFRILIWSSWSGLSSVTNPTLRICVKEFPQNSGRTMPATKRISTATTARWSRTSTRRVEGSNRLGTRTRIGTAGKSVSRGRIPRIKEVG